MTKDRSGRANEKEMPKDSSSTFSEDQLSATELNFLDDGYSRERFRLLVKQIEKGRVVAFIGAGVSRTVGEGVAGWDDIKVEMFNKLRGCGLYQNTENEEMEITLKGCGTYELAELCAAIFGKAFYDDLEDMLHIPLKPDKKMLEVHGKLLQVPFNTIVTTNWDNFFETASHDYCYQPIEAAWDDTSFIHNHRLQRPLLIKAHGTLSTHPVVTLRDVHQFEETAPLLTKFLEGIFYKNNILFIGYGFSDPDFMRLYFKNRKSAESTHYFLAIDEPEWRVKMLEQIGMQVIKVKKGIGFLEAYLSFIDMLLQETRLHTTDSITRAQRFAARLKRTHSTPSTLRVRAGLTAIGIPKYEETKAGEPIIEEENPVYSPEEYKAHDKLRESIKKSIEKAVDKGKKVKLILATSFQTMQHRAKDPRWSAECLRELIKFFKNEEGNSDLVSIVEREGPYEIQQFIIGEEEIIESRRLVIPQSAYYETRLIRNSEVVQDNIRVFDSCYQTFKLDALEKILNNISGDGFNSLLESVLDQNNTDDVWRTEEELIDKASIISRIIVGAGAEIKKNLNDDLFSDQKSELLKKAQKLRARILDRMKKNGKNTRENTGTNKINEEVKHLLSCETAYIVMLALNTKIVEKAIKAHLFEKWAEDAKHLEGKRSPHLRIKLLRPNNE